jgi:hypothetical protein
MALQLHLSEPTNLKTLFANLCCSFISDFVLFGWPHGRRWTEFGGAGRAGPDWAAGFA